MKLIWSGILICLNAVTLAVGVFLLQQALTGKRTWVEAIVAFGIWTLVDASIRGIPGFVQYWRTNWKRDLAVGGFVVGSLIILSIVAEAMGHRGADVMLIGALLVALAGGQHLVRGNLKQLRYGPNSKH